MIQLPFKRKIIFFSSLLVLFIILFLPQPAFAAWYDFLIGAVTFIPNVAIALIFYMLVVVTGLFSAFAGVILKWVISPSFISLSYTNPAGPNGNPIIATGLGITQGFVNMILVLILIYIALATILRLAGYETKKLLVTFVIVALLVNFAPVICGLIVDASNIVMNYFVKNLTGGQQLINSLKSIVDVATANFNWEVFKVTKQITVLAYLLMLAVFNFFLMIALGLFAAVFLIRYIAIWILVILSPLAFACYILPATKRYWELWWHQFLQWSFIGAIAGFFLYLGEQIATLSPAVFTPPSGELGSAILPYLVPLAFLYLGLMVGFSTSAYGASTVMGLTKKYGKKGGLYGAYGARSLANRAISSKWAEKIGIKEKLTEQAAAPLPGFRGKSLRGKIAAGVGYATGVIPTYWALRRGVGEATLRMTEAGKKDVDTAQDKYKGTTAASKTAAMRDVRLGWSHRIAALTQAIEEKQIDDIKKLGISNEEITNIGKAALRVHPDTFKKIRNVFPHLAEGMGQGFSQKTKEDAGLTWKNPAEATKYGNSIPAKLVATIKTANIPKMDIEGIFKLPPTDPIRVQIETAMHKYWTGEKVATAARNFDRTFIDPFMEMVKTKGKAWYKTENERLATYLNSSAAKGLGLELP